MPSEMMQASSRQRALKVMPVSVILETEGEQPIGRVNRSTNVARFAAALAGSLR